MKKLFKKATLLIAFVATMVVSPLALAAVPGGFEMGDFYRAKNDTKGGDFSDPVSAAPCDALTLRMRLHNPGPSAVNNVNVKATIPSGTGTSFSSLATVTAADADPQTVTDTVAIQVSQSAKINYVPGSSQLLDANGGVLQTLPDGALQSGVNIGNVGVSTQQKRFVQFKLKLDCPETPVCPPGTTGTPPNCVTPPVKNVVCDMLSAEIIGSSKVPAKVKFTAKGTASGGATINGYSFNFGDGPSSDSQSNVIEHTYAKAGEYKATVQVKSSLGTTAISQNCSVTIKVTEDQPPVVTPPETPTVKGGSLPSTGPEAAISGIFGTGALGYGIRKWLMSRRAVSDLLNQ